MALISLVALAAAAQSGQQWSRQPESGFRTFPPIAGVQVLQGEAVQDATYAPGTATPDPTRSALPDVGIVTGQEVVNVATPTPRPTPVPAPVRTPAPAPKLAAPAPKPVTHYAPTVAQAKAYALATIGSTQYSCLLPLWQHESGWNTYATNSRSGAYGIPQALPGYKMATAGADWRTNPVTQVKWGLGYIRARYGSACGAWSYWQAHGWY